MNKFNEIIKFDSLSSMISTLPDDNACREYLENVIWNGTPKCPHCQSTISYKLKTKGEFKGLYKCKDCRKRYTVTIGTMFESSHVPLKKWFIAIYIFTSHKKGISSHQLASDLGITQKSAWFVLSRIRNAFKPAHDEDKADGLFQIDECFIGGKNKNRHADKKVDNSQGRSVKDKTPVLGIMKTGGNVRTTVIPNTQAKTIKPIIESMISVGAIIVTDEWNAYRDLSKDYAHIVIKHNEGEYTKGAFHNNSIEGFWSLLKRGIYGIYHQVSPKHLNKYCDEFAFRYNLRKLNNNSRFNMSLMNTKKLTYKKLIE